MNKNNEDYNLKIPTLKADYYLISHLLTPPGANKEENSKYMGIQSWHQCQFCAFMKTSYRKPAYVCFYKVLPLWQESGIKQFHLSTTLLFLQLINIYQFSQINIKKWIILLQGLKKVLTSCCHCWVQFRFTVGVLGTIDKAQLLVSLVSFQSFWDFECSLFSRKETRFSTFEKTHIWWTSLLFTAFRREIFTP